MVKICRGEDGQLFQVCLSGESLSISRVSFRIPEAVKLTGVASLVGCCER